MALQQYGMQIIIIQRSITFGKLKKRAAGEVCAALLPALRCVEKYVQLVLISQTACICGHPHARRKNEEGMKKE